MIRATASMFPTGSSSRRGSLLAHCTAQTIAIGLICVAIGCQKSEPTSTTADPSSDASAVAEPPPDSAPTPATHADTAPPSDEDRFSISEPRAADADVSLTSRNGAVESDLQLPPVYSFAGLVEFLKRADSEIQRLGSAEIAPERHEALMAELERIARLKREAAERMLEAPELTDAQNVVAIRARMQSLSHLAALGDLKAAGALESYAVELLNHPADDIARDSRTVLVGFALERLQGGITLEPSEVLRFTGELTSRPELLDASALKVLQRAMTVLAQYGYGDAAQTIRVQLETFVGATEDPQLAEFARRILEAPAD